MPESALPISDPYNDRQLSFSACPSLMQLFQIQAKHLSVVHASSFVMVRSLPPRTRLCDPCLGIIASMGMQFHTIIFRLSSQVSRLSGMDYYEAKSCSVQNMERLNYMELSYPHSDWREPNCQSKTLKIKADKTCKTGAEELACSEGWTGKKCRE